jgi:hypothetical protein
MSKRWLIALLALVLAACARTPDEEAIRGTIQAMATSAEAGRAREVMDHISDDFIGNDGEFDRGGLERLLRAQVLARSLSARVSGVEIAVDGKRATATFALHLADSTGRWIPGRGTTLDVTTGWRRDGREWVCYNAKWTQRG